MTRLRVCNSERIYMKGFQGLTQHASSLKHRQQCKDKSNHKQLWLTSVSSQMPSSTSGLDNLNSNLHLYSNSDRGTTDDII